jgi:hypothetical protein
MKKTLFSGFALAACVFSAQAQFFTNGNLAVLRIGGPGQYVSTSDNGNSVSIDQYTTSGTLVSSLAIPSNGPNALIMDGEPYDGLMTITPDGRHLVIGGFNTSAPYAGGNFAFATSAAVPRAIATVDGYGNYALPIVNSNMFNTYTIAGAASDGSNFWAQGTGATLPSAYGVVYCGTATAPATNEVLTGVVQGGRGLVIYGNALYALGYPSNTAVYPQSGAFELANVSGDLPTNATTASVEFPTGTAAASTPMDLVINPAGTIAYVADYGFGIVKFSNSGSGWVSNYTVVPTNTGYSTASGSFHAISVTADFTQTPPVVYATTAESITNRLVMFQDTGATPTVINLASNINVSGVGGHTNTFRGVRFVPGSAPLITSQPASVVQSAAGSATFTVTALGSPTPSYQWYANGSPVAGATTSSLTYQSVTTFENGTAVDVIVSNAYGTATSSNATLTVNPNYFIPGNLVVVSVGGTGQSVSSTDSGNTVSVLQFTTGGTQVSTLPLPSTGPTAFVLDGSATEGFMSLSANGQYLVLGGYNAALPLNVGTNILEDSVSANAPRAVATIDGYGNYSMPIANTNVFNEFNIRGAAFDGTNAFWVSGSGSLSGSPASDSGVIYVGPPGSTGVNVRVGYTGTGNERCLNIYNNTLYVGTGSQTHGIWAITGPASSPPPIGLPTNAPVLTVASGSASGPYDFVFDPGNTTCYVADGNLGGIIKFTNNAGTWVSNYLLTVGGTGSATNAGGVAADFTQNPPVIYATTSETTGNRLISIVDNGPGSPFTLLAQASSGASGSNYFRGVRFVPGVPPVIATQPAPVLQDAGGSATFTLGVSGTPVLNYQWYTNGVAVSGATASSFILNPVTIDLSGTAVSVIVSNNFGTATSSNALLTAQPAGAPLDVTITPPTSVTANAGSTATFNVSAIGATLTYIWKLNGVQLSDGGSISGSSTATLTISPAYATYNGTYTVIASNSFGTFAANNSATLTVIDPVIITQPVGTTNLPGATAGTTLSVTAAGAPALTYQWLSNGVALAGATASSLNVPNSGVIVTASYSVVVSNALGNSIISAATVVSYTPVLLFDTFSYRNGNLFGDLGSPWTDINGTNPELVTNGRVQISQSNATTDAQSLFSTPESGQVMWASFIINVSTLPSNPGGVYFANLEDTNFGFYGRIFVLTSNQPGFTPNISPVAFPGTYRLGIANAQNDSTGTASTGPTAVVPLDLAPGIDYQVVFSVNLNPGADFSEMAVNPASLGDVAANSPGGVSSGVALDSFTPALPMAAFGLRQRLDSNPKGEGEGVMEMDNLVVSFDWNGPGSGYPVVTEGITPEIPVIGLQPVGATNFLGNPYVMEVAASGIGTAGVGLTYTWYQNGLPLSDGYSVTGSATPTLTINPLVATNSGTYHVIVSGAGGSVQSSNAVVLVDTTPTAPVFSVQPAANTTNSEGGSVTFTSLANGTGPITYAWYFNGNPLGVTTPDLTLSGLATNESGTYYVIATGDNGAFQTQSSNALLTVTGPKSVTIGYLRSLLNPTTYEPSDQSSLFSITGVITTATNQTTGGTASYYIQDSTGGINLFVTDGADFRPALGDEVTAIGTLSTYADNYELDVTEGAADYTNYVAGTNFPLPTPILLPWGNNTAPLSPFLSTNVEGSVVMITNVYFEAYTPGAVFASGTDYTITNNTGETYTVFVSDQDTNFVTGKPIPQFATSIAGPLIQDDTTIGITFTVYSNLVVPVPPPTFTVAITNPLAGAVFTAPANVNIAASATVSSGTITNVQFLTNGNSVGAAVTPPFSITASNLAAGTYELTAVATAAGLSATSSVVTITVSAPIVIPPLTNIGTAGAAVTRAGGTNTITLTWTAAPSNYTYSVWSTTNLLQPFSNLVSNLVFTNANGTYTDAGQTTATKYYEIRSP